MGLKVADLALDVADRSRQLTPGVLVKNRSLRLAVTATAAATLLATAGPAQATAQHAVATRLVVTVTPVTVLAGSTVALSGSVAPTVAGSPVLVQRLVGKTWRTLSRHTVTKTGGIAISVRAPKTVGPWVLRLSRAASAGAKPGTSGVLRLRVVAKAFAVTARATVTGAPSGSTVQVTGTVSRQATGAVWLQQLVGTTWHNLTSAKLTAHATFSLAPRLAPGLHRLRVAKAWTTTIAGGLSKAFSVTVAGPTSPTVTTAAALPVAMARKAYTVTLTAAGGIGPYTWTAVGLPAGLTLATDGVLSGTPTLAVTSTFPVTVQDTGGRTGRAMLTLVVSRTAGSAWAWGANDSGQLGNGTTTGSDAPDSVTGLTDVTQVVAGAISGGMALHADGTVSAWGGNTYGQLGNNSTTPSNVPMVVPGLTSIIAIADGIYVGYALRSDGTVWAWGYAGNGQLGNGQQVTDSHVPLQVPGLTGVTAIATHGASTFVLLSDGTLRSWGDNSTDGLGNGTTTIGLSPGPVSNLTGITAIAGTEGGGYALKSDHTVWAWGWNNHAQLGTGAIGANGAVPVQVPGITDATAIGGGDFAGLALHADGTVSDWGWNQYGALGNGSAADVEAPVMVTGLAGVTGIAGGGQSGYALEADGTAWAWGHNSSGQLGNGTVLDSGVPVAVSALRGIYAITAGAAEGYALNLG